MKTPKDTKLDAPAHTPGPWRALNYHTSPGWRIEANDFSPVVEPGWKVKEADARLIAAAPSLLAALKWALAQIEDDLDPDHQEALQGARDIVAVAEGRK